MIGFTVIYLLGRNDVLGVGAGVGCVGAVGSLGVVCVVGVVGTVGAGAGEVSSPKSAIK